MVAQLDQQPLQGLAATPPGGTCPVCGTPGIVPFVELEAMPVHCNLLWTGHSEALAAPRGDIRLGFCPLCCHVFNMAFDPSLMEYTQQYENSLHFSPRFQQFATDLAERLIARHDLHGKQIIEIGCGKGEFLSLICELGDNRGLGFDRSYVPGPDEVNGKITFVQDFYSEEYANQHADLVCCRHVLEHIQDPVPFLRAIRHALGERDVPVYFEVPNVLFTLRDLSIWDIIYEHCSYFSAGSLERLFVDCGFEVLDLREEFGGQFLGIEARPTTRYSTVAPWDASAAMASDVVTFADHLREKVENWRAQLAGIAQDGRRVAVWGAGSKGVTFMNLLAAQNQIAYVVDLNPRKQGMYVAGSGQRIVAPEQLCDEPPDVVLVMNRIYLGEIGQMLSDLGLSTVCIDV